MSLLAPAWTRHFVTPGAVSFAMLFAVDSMARASLATVIPLEVLRLLGNARDVSVMFTAVGCAGLLASLSIPTLIRRFRPRWVYTLGATLAILVPIALATGSFAGLSAGLLLRVFGAACLLNAFSLYIMAYIKKRDLARSEPLRTFVSAGSWTLGPFLGVWLYHNVSPEAVYALSAACAALLIVYFWRLRLEYGPALAAGEPAGTNPIANIRRYLRQPRLTLAYAINFGREAWWVTFYVYTPVYMVTSGESETAGALVISLGTGMLFLTPLFGWLARRFGLRRFLAASFLFCGAATMAVVAAYGEVRVGAVFLVASAAGAVALDSVAMVTFFRAVRARERPEMTMVFGSYRDLAGLLPIALYSVLLTFLDLRSVFAAVALVLAACAYLCRWVPRGM